MKLEIKNGYIAQCINLLDKLKLKGMDSIYRTRLNRELIEVFERFKKEDEEIKKEFCKLDKDGNPLVKNDKFVSDDEEGFLNALNHLHNETIAIDDSNSREMLKSVKKSLEEADIELEGEDAYTFEYLYSSIKEK